MSLTVQIASNAAIDQTLENQVLVVGANTQSGTNRAPIDIVSVFELVEIIIEAFDLAGTNAIITWGATNVINYDLQSNPDLLMSNDWMDVPPHTNIPGVDGSITVTNPLPTGASTTLFYRVEGIDP